jgi:hypothetical protein
MNHTPVKRLDDLGLPHEYQHDSAAHRAHRQRLVILIED